MNIIYILENIKIGKMKNLNIFLSELQNNLDKESQKKECKQDHKFGYCPHHFGGSCRKCWGYLKQSDRTIYIHTIKNFKGM